MKTRFEQTRVSLGALLLAGAALAADRTWDGGSLSDSKWSSVTNWDGDTTSPAAGDALFFGASSRLAITNDLGAGLSFAGLAFTGGAGAYVLSGDGITLDGNVSNLSTSAKTLNLPLALSGARMVYGSNAAFTVNGVVSGPGGLTANVTNSTLTLTAANTYEGLTSVTNGQLVITHSNALGSASAGTRVFGTSDASLKLSGTITVAEPLFLHGARPNYQSILIGDTGSNVVTSLITLENNNPRIRVESGTKTLVLAGGVQRASGGGNLGLNPQSGGRIIIKDKPILLGANFGIQSEYSGTVIFAVPSNTYSSMLICDHNKVRTEVADALCPTAQLTVGGSWVPDALLDLNGFDQTVGNLKTDGPKVNPGYLAVTSAVPATLTVNQSGDTSFGGALEGAVSLVKKGAGTLTFTNVISKTTGDLLVYTGTVAVAETGGFSACQNVRLAGGTLELRNSAALPDAVTVWISGGAKIKLAAGVNETVGYLFYDAITRRAGTYGSTGSSAQYKDDAHFSGTGLLTVLHDESGTLISLM